MKIGLIDSGSGCLSVLHEAYHMLPQETEYVIYADLDHVPYGVKQPEEIVSLTRTGIQFLEKQGAQAIVIACNTATGAAVRRMREEFAFPIVGMEPAIKPALELVDCQMHSASGKRVLAAATPLSIQAKKFSLLVERYDDHHLVDRIALPELVTFAEAECFEEERVTNYLQKELERNNYNKEAYGAVVLGCTHFNYFKPMFRKLFGEGVTLVDGRHGTIRHLADLMGIAYRGIEEPISFQTIEQLKEHYHSTLYISGRSATREQEEHWLRMMQRLETIRHI